MKITPFSLHLTLILIVLRLFIKSLSIYGIENFVSGLSLPSDTLSVYIFLYSGIDLYLFFFLYFFLNKSLKFNKANRIFILIFIFLIINIIHNIYSVGNVNFEHWEYIVLLISSIFYFIITIFYCFTLSDINTYYTLLKTKLSFMLFAKFSQ